MRYKIIGAVLASLLALAVSVVFARSRPEAQAVVCMLPGEAWGMSAAETAAWDALPQGDCPSGSKVNPNP